MSKLHPPYNEMIVTAILSLSGIRNSSSRQAITKFIVANYMVLDDREVHIRLGLKRLVGKGVLLQTRGTGATGSFKLNRAKLQPKFMKFKGVIGTDTLNDMVATVLASLKGTASNSKDMVGPAIEKNVVGRPSSKDIAQGDTAGLKGTTIMKDMVGTEVEKKIDIQKD